MRTDRAHFMHKLVGVDESWAGLAIDESGARYQVPGVRRQKSGATRWQTVTNGR